jgi:hypothetical protein
MATRCRCPPDSWVGGGRAGPDPHPAERLDCLLLALPGRHSSVDKRQRHVLPGRRPRQELEVLEHESDLAVAQRRPLVVSQPLDVPPAQPVAAARRGLETAEDVEQRGLAGPEVPTIATISPSSMEKDTPASAAMRSSPIS